LALGIFATGSLAAQELKPEGATKEKASFWNLQAPLILRSAKCVSKDEERACG